MAEDRPAAGAQALAAAHRVAADRVPEPVRDAQSQPFGRLADRPGAEEIRRGAQAATRCRSRCFELLDLVKLPRDFAFRKPRQLSGGQKQRIGIARAFGGEAAVVVADEPVSALDVSVQAAVTGLLTDIQRKKRTTLIFISHDLSVVRYLADRVVVMYLGRIMEQGTTEQIFSPPYHPYTEALLSAVPIADTTVRKKHIVLKGELPSPMNPPPGCPFQTRCPRKIGAICETELPPVKELAPGHKIMCHLPRRRAARHGAGHRIRRLQRESSMKSHYRAVVIGGGVVGCSVLYHLTKAGWRDVLLIERDELTSGSTWHAAGGFHTLNGDPNVAKLQGYTIGLYDELERLSGQSCGLHRTGGLMLADTPERMDWLKMAHARARYLGLETELLTVSEAKKLLPLIEERYFVGAMLDAADGSLDPSGTTHAYAKSARINGAEILLNNRVLELKPRRDGGWDVVTEQGTIRRRARGQLPAGCGPARSAAWSASSCRCSPWSTCIS